MPFFLFVDVRFHVARIIAFLRAVIAALLGMVVIVKSFSNRPRTGTSEEEVMNREASKAIKMTGNRFSAYSSEEAKALLSA